MWELRYRNYKRFVLNAAFFFAAGLSFAQQTYFQQEVNCEIRVSLNDVNHTLAAFEKIQYINNSASALDRLYFHLWPNAYRDNTTALAKQLLRQGRTELYFSEREERGFIDSLDFQVNGLPVHWEYDKEHHDICMLVLNSPLKPGDTLAITTPFFVKIPDAKFSRLGHTGQSYFITQWYPKPAVYDNEGWHAMPYLDQGEFYSEFGSFDVSITLPENYVLAATGDRQDADAEEDFLNNKVMETMKCLESNTRKERAMDFPPSSKKLKTVRFKQYNVHDFAWFSDKRFYALHDQIQLPLSKRTVDTWAFFTDKNFDLWKESISYINESTLFYSHLLGDYPYKHVTAVDGTIMAGGGMEYPNITVIGDMDGAFDLDVTIAHEVGHNWFYGILGNNERDRPLLDEGINSFYEMRYVRAKYPYEKLTRFIGRDTTFRFLKLNKQPVWKDKEIGYYMCASLHRDQPINSTSDEFTRTNYGTIVYGKSALVFDYLMDYLTEPTFDEAMRFYYNQFKYKHPTTKDLLKTLGFYGGVDLEGFEKSFINSTEQVDYSISKVKRNEDRTYTLQLKNRTGVNVPFNIYGFKDGKQVGVVWYKGFDKSREITFPDRDVDYFKIDGMGKLQDRNRRNNIIRTSGLFKRAKPIKLAFLTQFDDAKKIPLNLVPAIGGNYYNGFMLGLGFHNYGFYKRKFEYALAPMYAFKSKTLAGLGELNYNFFPKKIVQQITIGTKLKSFAYDHYNANFINATLGQNFRDVDLHYYKIAPYLELELKKKSPTSNIYQAISYVNTNLFTDSLVPSSFANLMAKTGIEAKGGIYSFVNQLGYVFENRRTIHPFNFVFNLQHTTSMAKVSGTFNYKITTGKLHFFELRLFAGTFIAGNDAVRSYYAFRSSGYTGYNDYLFEGNYLGRSEFRGLPFSQFLEKDGALKVWTPLGQSPKWITALNVKSPRIFASSLKIFADAVVCDKTYLLNDNFLWNAGINITLWKDVIEVYIPLAYSNDIKQTLELNNINFFDRIRFTFNIHKLEPKNFIKGTLYP